MALPVRYDPLTGMGYLPLISLRRDIDRLFGDVMRDVFGRSPGGEQGEESELLLSPRMDLVETDDGWDLEAELPGIDPEAVGGRMAAMPGVTEVHDLHIWTITSGFPALSAHVMVGTEEDCHARRRELADMLEGEFGIAHTTLQVEHADGRPRLVPLSPRSDPSGT